MLSPEVVPMYMPVMLSMLANVNWSTVGEVVFLHAKNNIIESNTTERLIFAFMAACLGQR